jgi:uncharacterized membrane protein (DUF373 family)
MNLPEFFQRFEDLVVKALLFIMVIVVSAATLELGYVLAKDILSPPILILETAELLDVFGMVMLVLIGLELFESIRVYHRDRVIRAEVVIVVAIIAVARKVIILDYKSLSSLTLLEVGVGILCLGLTYLLLKTNYFPFTKPPLKTRKQQDLSAEGE